MHQHAAFLEKRLKKTNGLRHQLLLKKFFLAKTPILKKFSYRIKNNSGHNNLGRLTNINRTTRLRKKYKHLTSLYFGTYIISAIHVNSLTNNLILKIFNVQTFKTHYINSIKNLWVGSVFNISADALFPLKGNRYPVGFMPTSSNISNILINKKIKFIKAAGTSAIILYKKKVFTKILLPSGKTYWILNTTLATYGQNGNSEYKLQYLGKASKNILKGRKSHVRGVAKNPIDHPHGGGQGKTKGGRASVTPWGICTKGKKTKKNRNKFFFLLS